MSQDEISSKALGEFLGEAQEIIESLNRDLLALDELSKTDRFDPDVLNNIFRAAHSLKGVSGMFGIVKMSSLAHNLENLLDSMRLGRVKLSPEILDVLFESIEVFNNIIKETSGGEPSDGSEVEDLILKIDKAASQESDEGQKGISDKIEIKPEILEVLTEYEEYRLFENINQGKNLIKVHAAFDLMNFDQGLADLNSKIKPEGEIITTLPSSETEDDSGIDFDIILGTDKDLEHIDKLVSSEIIRVELIKRKHGKTKTTVAEEKPVPESKPQTAPQTPPAPKMQDTKISTPISEPVSTAPVEKQAMLHKERTITTIRDVSQMVRVDIRKLDLLMNTLGELVLSKTNFQRIADGLKNEMGFLSYASDLIKETKQFEKKLDELQDGIMEVRMVQLRQIFDKLSRVTRKLSREANKEIEMDIEGAETELDKVIVEELSDPLMHIIRNSIDHGIELPHERINAGKPSTGHISIRAYQKGNHVIIDVRDNGKGMDEERIKQVALDKGIIEPHQVDELTKKDIYNFVFHPGFSTKKEVSEISGRGVGMDVVKTNISQLSGIIDIKSEKGVGTLLSITLPITLAIIKALVIRVGIKIYAIPLNSVMQIIIIKKPDIKTIERREVYQYQGLTLPLLRLASLFKIKQEVPISDENKLFVIVVGIAQNRMGIIVDELLNQQDIVIKHLGSALSHIKGIAGATDLGNRQTILVLDIAALVEETLAGGGYDINEQSIIA